MATDERAADAAQTVRLHRALSALQQMRTRLAAADRRGREPIAIVGLGCRFPKADSPAAFWDLLRAGRDATTDVPPGRWDSTRYFDPDRNTPGKAYTKRGAFIDGVELFDADFFGIAPREAVSLDPQQRLLLEVAWEALEHAGQAASALKGGRVGVFIGITSNDYARLSDPTDLASIDPYLLSGTSLNFAAGRLSHWFDFRGPSLAVDTACSSSLVAVHLACQSLRSGECDLALAGGVNLVLTPDGTIAACKFGMLSPDGRCKTFDARADGYGRGDGCGIVVLERLSDAARRGSILAVIRGSAVNHDGRSSGLTVPNGLAQQAVIRDALTNAGVDPGAVRYVEAHGTGTPLGDPIELHALEAVFGSNGQADRPLLVGSVKTNIGHLEAAAGVAGLMKVVLAIQHREIPAHLNFERLNPQIARESWAFTVPLQSTPWPDDGHGAVAGVSSFGASGTNAHVIVQSAEVPTAGATEWHRPKHLLCLSAKSEEALLELARRYRDRLSAEPAVGLADVCLSANAGRSHFVHRLTAIAASTPEMIERLTSVVDGASHADVTRATVGSNQPQKLAFLFTGQGSQYAGMGRLLFESQPTFRRALEECDQILRTRLEIPLLSAIYPGGTDASPLSEPVYAQPALFAFEYALSEMWRSWGVRPAMVLGHSIGEYVAACVAGVLGLEDALSLVAERGRLMQELPRNGAMVAALAPLHVVQSALANHRELSIAAINGPEQIVISGHAQAVGRVSRELSASGIRVQPLDVSHAFHSCLMDPVLDRFEEAAGRAACGPPRIGMVSSVSGRVASAELAEPAYWRRQIREPVRFADAIGALADHGCRLFLEIGPTAALSAAGRACWSGDAATWLPTIRRGRDDWDQLLATVAKLYGSGIDLDWDAFDRPFARAKVDLPTYPFSRKRFWKADAPAGPDIQRWLYRVEWRQQARGDGIAALREQFEHRFAEVQKEFDLATYEGALPQMESLATAFAARAIQELGFGFDVGRRFSTSQLAQELGVAAAHARFLERVLGILKDAEVLDGDTEGWIVRHTPVREDLAHRGSLIRASYPQCEPELSLLERCGTNLAAVLGGRTDALDVLFGNRTVNPEAMYRNAAFSRAFNALVASAVAAAVRGAPDGRRVRILELGAGTGSTTSQVLPLLPVDRVEYVFTDVSPHFTARAENAFHDYPWVSYRLLDLERDPAAQGFADHQFDIVVAANVVHATADLRKTLGHVRRLLASRGTLILLEGSAPQGWVDLIFGMTRGWWTFEDRDLRPWHPLLTCDTWPCVLSGAGFAEPITIPGSGASQVAQTLIVTRGPDLSHAAANAAADGSTAGAARWLVVADRGELGRSVVEKVRARGSDALLAEAKRGWTAADVVEGAPLRIDVTDPLQVREALRVAGRLAGVVYLATDVERSVADPIDSNALMEEQAGGCGGVLHVLQELTRMSATAARLGATPRLFVATRGVHALRGSATAASLVDAPLWGLGRTAALEVPEIWGGLIDVDPALEPAAAARAIAAELHANDGEPQVAVYGEDRFVARLARTEGAPTRARVTLRGAATYLVTGGLGGLGLVVAGWLVERGARHLVLLGRHGPSAAARAHVERLERAGASVMLARVDVADAGAMRRLFDDLAAGPPLGGVIHSAGILSDRTIPAEDWNNFQEVTRPKIAGAWNLHLLTRELSLDFFVLFSAAASVFGSPGQGNYAAANAFLDALAHHRRAIGLRGSSVNWGVWSETGLAAAMDRHQRRHVIAGLTPLSPGEGLAALECIMSSDPVQMTVMPAEWSAFAHESLSARASRFLADLLPAPPADSAVRAVGDAARPALVDRLADVPPAGRRALLASEVRAEVAATLGFDTLRLPTDKGFAELGMDSLMALDLKNRLQQGVGRSLPATMAFDYPTVDVLAAFIANHVLCLAPADSVRTMAVDEHVDDSFVAQLEQMSDDEAAELLTAHLTAFETRQRP